MTSIYKPRRVATATLLLLPLAACSLTDPYEREGTWRPGHSNDTNLRVMLADPADLVRGVDANGSNGRQATMAVVRLRNDVVKPLPDSGVSDLKTMATSAPQAAPPPPGAQ